MWLLRERYQFSEQQIDNILNAWHLAQLGKKPRITSMLRQNVNRKLKQAEELRRRVPPSLWDRLLTKAQESIDPPIPSKYWMFKWEYPLPIVKKPLPSSGPKANYETKSIIDHTDPRYRRWRNAS